MYASYVYQCFSENYGDYSVLKWSYYGIVQSQRYDVTPGLPSAVHLFPIRVTWVKYLNAFPQV